MLSYERGSHATRMWSSSILSYHHLASRLRRRMVASTSYGGLRNGDVSATIGCTPHILHIYASMTGLARYPAHTASDHATNPHVLVSCSLWAILSHPTLP